jgi:hypothetical protein
VDPTKLDAATDFDAVAVAMEGFLPAFVKESLTRAVMFAIDRQGGQRTYTIGTEDLVNSAHSLRPQLEALEGAGEGERRPALDQAFTHVIKGAVKALSTADEHGEGYAPVKEFDAEGDEIE